MAESSKTLITMACLGRTYSGCWHVRDGKVRVEAEFGYRVARLEGDAAPQLLAELLFRQLVRAQAARRVPSPCAVRS